MMIQNIVCYHVKDHRVFGQWFLTRGVVVIAYVDDLLLTGWQHHIDSITKALLAKYVMKKSGVLPEGKSNAENPSNEIDFLGARITRDADGTVWCDQSKYILHCMRENEFINKEGQVVLRRATAPPAVDEKLGEEEGTIREKNDALIMRRKYTGQMMWLTTRYFGVAHGATATGSQEPPSQLVKILVDYQRPCHVHSTLPRS